MAEVAVPAGATVEPADPLAALTLDASAAPLHERSFVERVTATMMANQGDLLPVSALPVDGTYPMARPLLMYTRGEPTGMVKKYLDWILSDAGQRIIMEKGYAPVRTLE